MNYFYLLITLSIASLINAIMTYKHIRESKANQVKLAIRLNNMEKGIAQLIDSIYGFHNVKFPAIEEEISHLHKIIDTLDTRIDILNNDEYQCNDDDQCDERCKGNFSSKEKNNIDPELKAFETAIAILSSRLAKLEKDDHGNV